MKPHMYKSRGFWVCHGDHEGIWYWGEGETVALAYWRWRWAV